LNSALVFMGDASLLDPRQWREVIARERLRR
jgi:hypothetical protein